MAFLRNKSELSSCKYYNKKVEGKVNASNQLGTSSNAYRKRGSRLDNFALDININLWNR